MFAAVHAPEGASLSLLVTCASDFSPYVEETAPDTVTVRVTGLAHLFGSAREIGDAMARHAAESGLDVNVAIAPNPDLAVHGARGLRGVTVMETGREAALPIELLDPPPGIAETLVLWGIRTFGDLAALPADGVAERLGEEGTRLRELARGAGHRPLVPTIAAPVFEDSMELDYPVALLEPLSFILGRLAGTVCARLESHGLATHELRLRLKLEEQPPEQDTSQERTVSAMGTDSSARPLRSGQSSQSPSQDRTLRFPYPMRDARVFLKLLTLDLEMRPPGAPVLGVSLAAEPVNPRVVQHGLFIPLAPEPQKLELTLARIRKLVGEEKAGSPELVETHRPGAFRMRPFAPGAHAENVVAPPATPHRLALRAFRPALPAMVDTREGRPERVAARGIRGNVVDCAGPWRTSGDWWRDDAWSWDEWDVALSDGALYLLCRDRHKGTWLVEGSYD